MAKAKKKKKTEVMLPSEPEVEEAITAVLSECEPPATDVDTAIPYEELAVKVVRHFDPNNQWPFAKVNDLLKMVRALVNGPGFQLATDLRVYTA